MASHIPQNNGRWSAPAHPGGTMAGADKILAQRLGLEEWQVRQWINDNQYVWHERQDGKHIDLLCRDIHGNIPHSGGISANKQRLNR